jgi:hypothetical protein
MVGAYSLYVMSETIQTGVEDRQTSSAPVDGEMFGFADDGAEFATVWAFKRPTSDSIFVRVYRCEAGRYVEDGLGMFSVDPDDTLRSIAQRHVEERKVGAVDEAKEFFGVC